MKISIVIIALLLIVASCKKDSLTFEVANSQTIQNLPSGSGIVAIESGFYAIGDDSPFLYLINTEDEIISKTPIYATENVANGRIVKEDKPDFESLEVITENELIGFGSGSKSPKRDIFLHIFLESEIRVKTYNISDFYNNLRKLKVMENEDLNIEAVAFQKGQIYLFNRGKNLIFNFVYKDFLAYIKDSISFPKPIITEFHLPKINGVESGFSGATILKEESKILFTSSVENTTNAYDDGEILGSFIGTIDMEAANVLNSYEAVIIPNIENPLKVESVAIVDKIEPGEYKVVLITDDDKGNSIKIDGLIEW
ncbi:hypothetical protein QSV08_02690 [Maribacter sp. BPC-D8]|uniref:DUF6929 family protein n=1 Tax=Maribacter sp. BPC-D8 TaxID=3053613 RepID=UPI002B49F8B0|nr:hypothetical protein [Maribacter sp. BPC-D8]WRI30150.1 hypothetical protein QSV08_02690 [Maribacter sp. BPC-D8]